MDESIYVAAIADFYMCDTALAKKIIKSADLNGTRDSLDKIVEDYTSNDK